MVFSDLHISIAKLKDATVITQLLNSAYRGESSQQGWTTESHLIGGEVRTIPKEVEELITQPDSVFLKYTTEEIIGCVNLQKHEDKIYLGMLSVKPGLQGGGIGKKLLSAADEYAKQLGCIAVYMTVISVRTELIDWYLRHGFIDTNIRKPFEEDGVSGNHLQKLEFAVLEKKLQK